MMKKYIYSSWVATARHLSSSHTISNQPPFTSTIHVLLHYIHVACLWSSSPPLPRRSIFNFVYLAYSHPLLCMSKPLESCLNASPNCKT